MWLATAPPWRAFRCGRAFEKLEALAEVVVVVVMIKAHIYERRFEDFFQSGVSVFHVPVVFRPSTQVAFRFILGFEKSGEALVAGFNRQSERFIILHCRLLCFGTPGKPIRPHLS